MDVPSTSQQAMQQQQMYGMMMGPTMMYPYGAMPNSSTWAPGLPGMQPNAVRHHTPE